MGKWKKSEIARRVIGSQTCKGFQKGIDKSIRFTEFMNYYTDGMFTLFFLSKDKVYKDIEAEILLKIKDI